MKKKDVKKAVKKALEALWFQCGDDLDDDQVERILDCIDYEIRTDVNRFGPLVRGRRPPRGESK